MKHCVHVFATAAALFGLSACNPGPAVEIGRALPQDARADETNDSSSASTAPSAAAVDTGPDAGSDAGSDPRDSVQTGPCVISYDIDADGDGDWDHEGYGYFDVRSLLVRFEESNRGPPFLITRLSWDDSGHLLERRVEFADGQLKSRERKTYNDDGHEIRAESDNFGDDAVDFMRIAAWSGDLLLRTEYDWDGVGPEEPMISMAYEYDEAGVEARVINFESFTILSRGYDIDYRSSTQCVSGAETCAAGEERLVAWVGTRVLHESNVRSSYSYRLDGQVAEVIEDDRGNGEFESRIRYSYDQSGRQTAFDSVRFEDRSLPRSDRQIDEQGAAETHDAAGRPTRWRITGGSGTRIRSHVYNETGDEVEQTEAFEDAPAELISWRTTKYDGQGRRTEVRADVDGDNGIDREELWTYDEAGRELTYEVTVWNEGRRIQAARMYAASWTEDGAGMVWDVDSDGDLEMDQMMSCAIDGHGHRTRTRWSKRSDEGPQVFEQRLVDSEGRLLERRFPRADGTTVLGERQQFDSAGRSTELVLDFDGDGVPDVHTQTAYDALGRETAYREDLTQGGGWAYIREATSRCLPAEAP